MSVSYTAIVMLARKFNREDFVVSKPNPDWNKEAPFDPKTGKPVPKTLDREYDFDEIAEKYDLATWQTPDGVFIGWNASNSVDLDYDDNASVVVLPSENREANVEGDIGLIETLLGLPHVAPKMYLLTSVS